MKNRRLSSQLGYEPNEVSTICGLTEKRVQKMTKLLMKGTLFMVSLLCYYYSDGTVNVKVALEPCGGAPVIEPIDSPS